MIAEHIELEDVVSSNIGALGYNDRKRIAALRFKSGEIFHFAGVPREVFWAWYTAESKGKFFRAEIQGKYQGDKMTGHCPKCGALGWVGELCEDCGCAEIVADVRKMKRGQDGASVSVQGEGSAGALDTRDPDAGR